MAKGTEAESFTDGKRTLRVAIAAGGTGGHIMPALALGDALSNIGHPVDVQFLCGSRDLEREIYADAEIDPIVFPVRSISSGGRVHRAIQMLGMAYTFMHSMWIMRRFDVVVGMGGYITGPVLSAAKILRIPFVLHDSNTVLGKVNTMMAPFAAVIAQGMPLLSRPEQVPEQRFVELGTPVRRGISRGSREEAAPTMFLADDEAFTILILGGSQGARGVNTLVADMLDDLMKIWPEDRLLQLIWATGSKNIQQVRDAVHDKPFRGRMWLAPTLERMDHAYAMADLVIGRAGGSTLAEILVCNLPSILIPYPQSKEDHQKYNATVLKRKGAALIFDEAESTASDLAKGVFELASDPEFLDEMADSARVLSCPDAARDLARIVVEVGTGQRELAGAPSLKAGA